MVRTESNRRARHEQDASYSTHLLTKLTAEWPTCSTTRRVGRS